MPTMPPSPVDMLDPTAAAPVPVTWGGAYTWQIVPDGLMYKEYLAGRRESRMSNVWAYDSDKKSWFWDATLGGHVAVLRYGTQDALWPEGFEADIDGAAFPRLDGDRNLVSADFRVGLPLTFRQGPWEGKFGYYHLCSHISDAFLEMNPGTERIPYVRDSLVLGVAYRLTPDLRFYGEADWAFHTDGGAKPWEFEFGAEYSSMQPTGFRGSPFVAVNGTLRQDVDYGGNFAAQAGWQWRGVTGRLFRIGAEYFTGKSDQRQFFRINEQLVGVGIWYDY
jgi:hypothetical protein